MPFIYKDTKNMFVILIPFLPSCNILNYFIKSLNQKHFSQYVSILPTPLKKKLPNIVQGMRRTSHTIQCFNFKM